MLSFSDDLKSLKKTLLIFSSVSLFISMTEELPTKISVLGLDLSKNENFVGWFLAALTGYFLVSFFVSLSIEIYEYLLPWRIAKRTANTTGRVIGLTLEEICRDAQDIHQNEGTESGEIEDINTENKRISIKTKKSTIRLKNRFTIGFDVILPLMYSAFCFLSLLWFLYNK